MLKSCKN